ncbi:MAG: hypothetical protein ACRC9L_07710 [Brevinema sp.]
MNKWILSLILIFASCNVAPSGDNSELISIDTSAEAQAKFKSEWISLTRGKVFEGLANVYGAGGSTFFSVFSFDSEGNLHNTSHDLTGWDPSGHPQGYTGLHRILIFYSGTQAVVSFYKSAASTKLHEEIYALEIRNNTIYRTSLIVDNIAMGFTTTRAWDGATYSRSYMEEFAPISSRAAPSPELTVPDVNS